MNEKSLFYNSMIFQVFWDHRNLSQSFIHSFMLSCCMNRVSCPVVSLSCHSISFVFDDHNPHWPAHQPCSDRLVGNTLKQSVSKSGMSQSVIEDKSSPACSHLQKNKTEKITHPYAYNTHTRLIHTCILLYHVYTTTSVVQFMSLIKSMKWHAQEWVWKDRWCE